MFENFLKQYPDYKVQEKPTLETIEKYKDFLPKEIIDFWSNYGFGTYMSGYLKVVNPSDFEDILKDSYVPIYQNPVVMFATAMSDLIIWENGYTILLDYRHGTSKVLESGFKYFIEDLCDKEFLHSDLLGENYFPAKEKLGEPAFDESYGYVPLLGLGGAEKVENLQKVKLNEHIAIVAQALGKIG